MEVSLSPYGIFAHLYATTSLIAPLIAQQMHHGASLSSAPPYGFVSVISIVILSKYMKINSPHISGKKHKNQTMMKTYFFEIKAIIEAISFFSILFTILKKDFLPIRRNRK